MPVWVVLRPPLASALISGKPHMAPDKGRGGDREWITDSVRTFSVGAWVVQGLVGIGGGGAAVPRHSGRVGRQRRRPDLLREAGGLHQSQHLHWDHEGTMPPPDPLSTRPLFAVAARRGFTLRRTGFVGIAPLAPDCIVRLRNCTRRQRPLQKVCRRLLSRRPVAESAGCCAVPVCVWGGDGVDVQQTTNALIDILHNPDSTTEFDCGCWPQYKDALIDKYESLPADGTPASASAPTAPTAARRLLQDSNVSNADDGTCGGIDTVRARGLARRNRLAHGKETTRLWCACALP